MHTLLKIPVYTLRIVKNVGRTNDSKIEIKADF